jgi:hypothetical protein
MVPASTRVQREARRSRGCPFPIGRRSGPRARDAAHRAAEDDLEAVRPSHRSRGARGPGPARRRPPAGGRGGWRRTRAGSAPGRGGLSREAWTDQGMGGPSTRRGAPAGPSSITRQGPRLLGQEAVPRRARAAPLGQALHVHGGLREHEGGVRDRPAVEPALLGDLEGEQPRPGRTGRPRPRPRRRARFARLPHLRPPRAGSSEARNVRRGVPSCLDQGFLPNTAAMRARSSPSQTQFRSRSEGRGVAGLLAAAPEGPRQTRQVQAVHASRAVDVRGHRPGLAHVAGAVPVEVVLGAVSPCWDSRRRRWGRRPRRDPPAARPGRRGCSRDRGRSRSPSQSSSPPLVHSSSRGSDGPARTRATGCGRPDARRHSALLPGLAGGAAAGVPLVGLRVADRRPRRCSARPRPGARWDSGRCSRRRRPRGQAAVAGPAQREAVAVPVRAEGDAVGSWASALPSQSSSTALPHTSAPAGAAATQMSSPTWQEVRPAAQFPSVPGVRRRRSLPGSPRRCRRGSRRRVRCRSPCRPGARPARAIVAVAADGSLRDLAPRRCRRRSRPV